MFQCSIGQRERRALNVEVFVKGGRVATAYRLVRVLHASISARSGKAASMVCFYLGVRITAAAVGVSGMPDMVALPESPRQPSH